MAMQGMKLLQSCIPRFIQYMADNTVELSTQMSHTCNIFKWLCVQKHFPIIQIYVFNLDQMITTHLLIMAKHFPTGCLFLNFVALHHPRSAAIPIFMTRSATSTVSAGVLS